MATKIPSSNKMSSRPLAAATPKAAPDRALEPGRSVGSGPSMAKTLPAPGTPKTNTPKQNVDPGFSKTLPSPKYTPVPMPTPTFKSDGGRTAVPMPAPKQIGPKSKYTPVPMPTPKFGR